MLAIANGKITFIMKSHHKSSARTYQPGALLAALVL
jgi:hypothetical protein